MKLWILLFFCIQLFAATVEKSQAQTAANKYLSAPDSSFMFSRLDADSLLKLKEKYYLGLPGDRALAYASALAGKADTIRVDTIRKTAWLRVAQVYLKFDKEQLAEPFIQKLTLPLQKAGDFVKESTLLNDLGKFCYQLGKDSLAVKYFSNSILLGEKLNNNTILAVPYSNMTILFLRRGMNDKCIDFGLKTLELAQQSGSLHIENEITTVVGEAYERKGELQKAYAFFERSLALANENGAREFIYQNLGKLCMVNIKLNRMDTADYYAIKLKKELGKSKNMAVFPNNALAEMSLVHKKFTEARNYAMLAIRNSKDAPRRPFGAYSVLYRAYKGLNKPDSALMAYETYWELYAPKVLGEKDNIVLEIEQKFQSYQKEQEITLLKKDKELGDTQRKGAYIIAGFLAVTAFLYYTRYRIKKKSSDALTLKGIEIEKQRELIQTSLSEKETLLREIHHRVKNNLQIISSLLNIQSAHIEDENILASIKEGQSRVQAMSLIHQNLYLSENINNVDIESYLQQLVVYLSDMFGGKEKSISVSVNAPGIHFDIDTAIPLGLIVNELVSNAYKYAFENQVSGNINVGIKSIGTEDYELLVEDNGSGFKGDISMEKSISLGLKLVKILSRQLRGTFSASSEMGASFLITFKDLRAYQLARE
jgi:two-component system, sensor histidine kinase PdtaS